jgi:ribosomal-protein-alanine N-acetyltransferase
MRKYKTISVSKELVDEIYCNCCGKRIEKNAHQYFQDHLHVEKQWEYHSKKDGKKHEFDICEECYDKWIKSFKISIEKNERHL